MRKESSSRAKAPSSDVLLLPHAGKNYRIRLKRHAQARRYTLRISHASPEAVLTLPLKASLKAAQAFVAAHEAWLLQGMLRRRPLHFFEPGVLLPLRGVPHLIVHRPQDRRPVWIESYSQTAPPSLCVGGELQHLSRRLYDYLKAEALKDLRESVEHYRTLVRCSIASIQVRDTKSRWGSCSNMGRLNFSWRLILAPPYVLDYLAAHEVAHRVHMNHTPQFWALTRRLCPATDQAESWLKKEGSRLHMYQPILFPPSSIRDEGGQNPALMSPVLLQ